MKIRTKEKPFKLATFKALSGTLFMYRTTKRSKEDEFPVPHVPKVKVLMRKAFTAVHEDMPAAHKGFQ